MALPLIWPGAYYFYPLGNTPAVNLARDVAPEDDADILLLGCGDPRNVLCTIFNEPVKSARHLNFTCCDVDPAVLARNVLLFTMVIDGDHDESVIWATFYHFDIDDECLHALDDQCRKLVAMSSTEERWRASDYSKHITFCTANTLPDLRHHWNLWMEFVALNPEKRADMKSRSSRKRAEILKGRYGAVPARRSFGPLLAFGTICAMKSYQWFWKNGTMLEDFATAVHLNPTFLYSLGGQGVNVHRGTDPLSSFHLAPALAAHKDKMPDDVQTMVKAAQLEFSRWCTAYRKSLTPMSKSRSPIIRFAAADAIAFCEALRLVRVNKCAQTSIPVRQWRADTLVIDDAYLTNASPSRFNVIDTSNLCDHIGLWNVLLISTPLLSRHTPPTSTLYTEFLVSGIDLDMTKNLIDSLFCDIPIVALCLNLAPVDFISDFQSDSPEVTESLVGNLGNEKAPDQFRQLITWKAPTFGQTTPHAPIFNSTQLGTYLFSMYRAFFAREDVSGFTQRSTAPRQNTVKAIQYSNIAFHSRETFVVLLKVVRERLDMPVEEWNKVMTTILSLQSHNELKTDSCHIHDFHVQLHAHGVYTIDSYTTLPSEPDGLFARWRHITPAVRVFLTIPLNAPGLTFVRNAGAMTLPLECAIYEGSLVRNVFSSVQIAFGRLIKVTWERVEFQEERAEWDGNAPLVASFIAPTTMFTNQQTLKSVSVQLSLRPSPVNSMIFECALGPCLSIFSAKVLDTDHVHIIPMESSPTLVRGSSTTSPAQTTIGVVGPCTVALDEKSEFLRSMTVRLSITSKRLKAAFSQGTISPTVAQTTPCTFVMQIQKASQVVHFPYYVDGRRCTLKLNRASFSIDVIAPASAPFTSRVFKLLPFPVIVSKSSVGPWNIHRVNLEKLPPINLSSSKLYSWLNMHIGAMYSARERKAVNKHRADRTSTMDDTLALTKDTVHTMFAVGSGIQGGTGPRNIFILLDKASSNCDTVFFINGLKFDVFSDTVVIDAYVLPTTESVMVRIRRDFGMMLNRGNPYHVGIYGDELASWKHLLPALAERCRTWAHNSNCEYRAQGRVPLTTERDENPLCSCGQGKDVEGMMDNPLWRPFARYVTRIALSPLFGVIYAEKQIKDPACAACHLKGEMRCRRCKQERYCSTECQKKDWPLHRRTCKRTELQEDR